MLNWGIMLQAALQAFLLANCLVSFLWVVFLLLTIWYVVTDIVLSQDVIYLLYMVHFVIGIFELCGNLLVIYTCVHYSVECVRDWCLILIDECFHLRVCNGSILFVLSCLDFWVLYDSCHSDFAHACDFVYYVFCGHLLCIVSLSLSFAVTCIGFQPCIELSSFWF